MGLIEHMRAGVAIMPPGRRKSQLQANRFHALNAWCHDTSGLRWPGDDGRVLRLAESAYWPAEIQAAEQGYFAKIDAAYEAVKAELGA